MKRTRGTQRAGLMVLCGFALVLAKSGCVFSVTWRGVSNMDEINRPQTRAEVHAAFGDADETGTCPDGRRKERLVIWQRFTPPPPPPPPRFEPVMHVIRAEEAAMKWFWGEQGKHHYTFVYDAHDRVLYRYDHTITPTGRVWQVLYDLTDSLLLQVEAGSCPFWKACFTAFTTEVRHRAACVGYPLTGVDEENLHLLQALAADVDAGRLARDEALAELKRCLRSPRPPYWSCHQP